MAVTMTVVPYARAAGLASAFLGGPPVATGRGRRRAVRRPRWSCAGSAAPWPSRPAWSPAAWSSRSARRRLGRLHRRRPRRRRRGGRDRRPGRDERPMVTGTPAARPPPPRHRGRSTASASRRRRFIRWPPSDGYGGGGASLLPGRSPRRGRPTPLAGIALGAGAGARCAGPSARRRRRSWPPRWPWPGGCSADSAIAVGAALDRGDLEQARALLPTLVGRDPSALDASEVARAVVESVAENTVDAVLAPACWAAALGRPACWPTGP